jgi:hypothetical protein
LEKMKSWFDRIGLCEMEHSNDGVVSLEARPAAPQRRAEVETLRHTYTSTPRSSMVPVSTCAQSKVQSPKINDSAV